MRCKARTQFTESCVETAYFRTDEFVELNNSLKIGQRNTSALLLPALTESADSANTVRGCICQTRDCRSAPLCCHQRQSTTKKATENFLSCEVWNKTKSALKFNFVFTWERIKKLVLKGCMQFIFRLFTVVSSGFTNWSICTSSLIQSLLSFHLRRIESVSICTLAIHQPVSLTSFVIKTYSAQGKTDVIKGVNIFVSNLSWQQLLLLI